jgi:short-subunit dehydrogenase
MNFGGKSIIITGASAGIGAALAIELARQGAHLTLAARSLPQLEAVAAQCNSAGGRAIAVMADVGEQSDCQRVIQSAVAEFGGIDVLVNNAGVSMWTRFDGVSDLAIFEKIMRINYLGAVYCTHYALPLLKQSRGLIVAVSSLTGKFGTPTRTGYAASKHAMQGFFDSLRIELYATGVDVLVISPGFVATEIRARAFGADGQARGTSPRAEDRETMSLEECVRQTLQAMQRRQRELVMTAKGRLGQWIKLLSPQTVDRLALRAVRERDEK